jgi:hypothetical protein
MPKVKVMGHRLWVARIVQVVQNVEIVHIVQIATR